MQPEIVTYSFPSSSVELDGLTRNELSLCLTLDRVELFGYSTLIIRRENQIRYSINPSAVKETATLILVLPTNIVRVEALVSSTLVGFRI